MSILLVKSSLTINLFIMGGETHAEFAVDCTVLYNQALRDPVRYAAEHVYKISRESLLDYLASDGRVQCCATTKTGDRCRNRVGSAIYNPRKWVQDGAVALCHQHGGGHEDVL